MVGRQEWRSANCAFLMGEAKEIRASLAAAIGLPPGTSWSSFQALAANDKLMGLVEAARQADEQERPLAPLEKAAQKLEGRLLWLQQFFEGEALRAVPAAQPGQQWTTPSPLRSAADLRAVLDSGRGAARLPAQRAEREITYNRARPTRTAWVVLALSLLLSIVAWNAPRRGFDLAAGAALVAGFAVMSWGIWLRWSVAGRIPASNMYESLLFLAWGTGAFALVALPAVLPNLRTYGSIFGMPRLAQASVAHAALARGREIVTTGAHLWLWAAGLVAAAVAVTLLARTAKAPEERRSSPAIWLLGGWIAFYGCALFLSLAPYARSDPLDGRFLAPVAPAAVVLLVRWLTRGRAASRVAVAAASLLALGTYVRVGWVHRADLPAADPVATWSIAHAREDSLFVGTELWELPHWAGAVVLTDGYPEMPALAPARVSDFLLDQGARFRTVHLVYGGAAGLKAGSAPAYVRAMRAIGFRARGADRLADGSVVVTLAR